jgi:hypothetical protein
MPQAMPCTRVMVRGEVQMLDDKRGKLDGYSSGHLAGKTQHKNCRLLESEFIEGIMRREHG